MFTDLNPEGNRFTTAGPLFGVLMLSLAKQFFEDYKRHKADGEMNSRKVERLTSSGQVEVVRWSEVRMGDILRVMDRQEFAADVVILSSSEADGKCYTETANLDGETNLKRRVAVTETSELCSSGEKGVTPQQQSILVSKLRGHVEYEAPNNRLYNFTGRLVLDGKDPVALFPENIILRGCMLRSCSFVYGLVVFTGFETKIMKNMRKAPLKSSNVYKMVNNCVFLLFLFLVVMMVGSSLQFSRWQSDIGNAGAIATYLLPVPSASTSKLTPDQAQLQQSFLSLLTFLMLYANLVPISLYVSMDFIKVMQAYYIEKDPLMVHNNTPAKARTSDLNED
jgi:phospholipid-transporting ATPase